MCVFGNTKFQNRVRLAKYVFRILVTNLVTDSKNKLEYIIDKGKRGH